MKIVGMHSVTNSTGQKTTTIHGVEEFDLYYTDVEAGRSCVGNKVETVYVGAYDCSALKVGMDIEIFYDKAVTTARGTFQPIKRIDVLSKQ